MIVKNKKQKVFIGLSGGVDSSVSAYLLKTATPNNFEKLFDRPTPEGFKGYDVTGVFIRTWQPEFAECTWRDERRDAMRMASFLDIPFLECDAEEAYKKGVADYMIEEYKKGNTPNPDVMCNREVKFGVFWQFAEERGADFIATGHYARVADATRAVESHELKTKNYHLLAGIDPAKDQSYFLWTLKHDDLAHVLFPVGHLNKNEVRDIGRKVGIPTAEKKDSQGVCFIGPIDMKEFLSHYMDQKEGDVLDIGGEVIGKHIGALFYTLGERHGFTLQKRKTDAGRMFVVAKDVEQNTITVSDTHPDKGENSGQIFLEDVNIISLLPETIDVNIRYHGERYKAKLVSVKAKYVLTFLDSKPAVAVGQSIVFYDNDTCCGGGVVAEA